MRDKRVWIVDINFEFWNIGMNLEVWTNPPMFWNYEAAKEHFFSFINEAEKFGGKGSIQCGTHGVIFAVFEGLEDKGLISYDLRWKNVPDLEIGENDNPSTIWGLDINAHALKYPMMYVNYEKAKERFDWYTSEYEKQQLVSIIECGEKQQLYATFKDKQGERGKLDLIRLNVHGDIGGKK